ncbi:amidophosphoribosyltransferase [Candidatus Micrarchaeota archaeon]|nr:amidophosphoribosyltransferase [Candidatus Micrarchaeota archaeon]
MVIRIMRPHSEDFEEKHEECGLVAIYSKKGKPVAQLIYRALMALQHRGQDAAGFAIFENGKIEVRKGLGLVNEAFKIEDFDLLGPIGIGHTRYPTAGLITKAEIHPFVNDDVAIAHNGHLANYKLIKKDIEKRHTLVGTSDSEVISILLKENLSGGIDKAVGKIMDAIDGAYSNVGIVQGKIIAFRDPHAIRPLVYGENQDYICFASETTALDINNIGYSGDLGPGELAVIENGKIVKKTIKKQEPRHCMFEYVYFARPDSVINKLSVLEVRKKLGQTLAREQPVKADVIVPIPDTARTAAGAFSKESGIMMDEGLIKNRYIGRTFIMPSQDKRKAAVSLKLNPVKSVVSGKRVVLIDDSIVRGTTLREIVSLVRGAGAKEVHLRITCPPLIAPCFYGVDMATYKELIANNKSVEEIRKFLGADSLGYISISGLKKAIGLPVCTGCLNEEYVTPYAKKLALEKRDDEAFCG